MRRFLLIFQLVLGSFLFALSASAQEGPNEKLIAEFSSHFSESEIKSLNSDAEIRSLRNPNTVELSLDTLREMARDPYDYSGLSIYLGESFPVAITTTGRAVLNPHVDETPEKYEWIGFRGRFETVIFKIYGGDLISSEEDGEPSLSVDWRSSAEEGNGIDILRVKQDSRLPLPDGYPDVKRLQYATLWAPLAWLCRGVEFLYRAVVFIPLVGWTLGLLVFAIVVRLLMLPIHALTLRARTKVNEDKAKLAPEFERIKSELKGETAHKAMMAAYKDIGVTPYHTLRPFLFTMIGLPVLIAIFNMLGELVDLRKVSFLWIDSLAYPDALAPLPFKIPLLGDTLNLLPFLMAGATVLSSIIMKPNGATSAELRKQRFGLYGMAILFFFLFYPFPSAMVLYWTFATLLALFITGKSKHSSVNDNADVSEPEDSIVERDSQKTDIKSAMKVSPVIRVLSLAALGFFAFSSPLLSSLGDAPTFLVAHNMELKNLIYFVGMLIVLPVIIALILNIFALRPSRKSVRFANLIFYTSLFVFAAITTFVTLNGTSLAKSSAGMILSVLAALGGAALFTLLFYREAIVRQGLAFASIILLVAPIFFLFFTPVKAIVQGGKDIPVYDIPLDSDTPVIVLLFDEFTPLPLHNPDGSINAVRFPNFAALAKDSLVFDKAASAHVQSYKAVPAALSAQIPPNIENLLPIHSNYPDNLFTFLGGRYDLKLLDNFTALCPPSFCDSGEVKSFEEKAFRSDLKVVLRHIYTPKAYADHLPPLDAGWRDFAQPQKGDITDDNKKDKGAKNKVKNSNVNTIDDIEVMDEFLASFDDTPRTFYYLHTIFPHRPYQLLPDHRRYEALPTPNPMGTDVERMTAYHRYIWQVGAADKMVGDLMERLKAVGIYDDALIIITADHGLTFIPGLKARVNNPEHPSALHIPMFVKLPGSVETGVRDDFVSNLDVLPTIADVLGAEIPWPVDGKSMLIPRSKDAPNISYKIKKNPPVVINPANVADPDYFSERYQMFASNLPLDRVGAAIAYPNLIGTVPRPVAQLEEFGVMQVDTSKYLDVDKSDPFLPVFLKASLPEGLMSSGVDYIAVALNNKISTITAPVDADGNDLHITFPPAGLKNGANTISFFAIKRSKDGSPSLWALSSEYDDSVPLVRPQNILTPKQGGLMGSFTKFEGPHGGLSVRGWAFDAANELSNPTHVGIYTDGELVARGTLDLTIERLNLSNARFRMDLPSIDLDSEIEVIAFTPDGRALLLKS